MKRIVCILLALVLLFGVTACAQDKESGPLSVVTTSFAAFDWARSVIGDAQVSLTLIGGGSDPHSYNPTAADIVAVTECDLLIYVGGSGDSWAGETERKDGSVSVNMIDAIGDRVYRVHDHGTETDTVDEHVWLSIDNAHIISKKISDALSQLDPDNMLKYDDNRERLALELNALDSELRTAVDGFSLPTIIVADRFPYAYLAIDYNIGWYAAFSDCTTDADATFATVTQMAAVIDELSVRAVVITETGTDIADTVLQNTKNKDCQTVVVNSMQAASEQDSYIGIMRDNISAIKLALVEDTK